MVKDFEIPFVGLDVKGNMLDIRFIKDSQLTESSRRVQELLSKQKVSETRIFNKDDMEKFRQDFSICKLNEAQDAKVNAISTPKSEAM